MNFYAIGAVMLSKAIFQLLLPLSIAMALVGCSTDPEALNAASDAYDNGGLLGAFVATTPEAVAERKQKAALRAAYRAKVCASMAAPGTPAHEGCILQMAEDDARKDQAVRAMRSASRPVTCHKVGDSVMCN